MTAVTLIYIVCRLFFVMSRRPPTSTLFPYTTLFRSGVAMRSAVKYISVGFDTSGTHRAMGRRSRSEEHTHDCRHTDIHRMPSFFCNVTATTDIYTLSLHDALPIWRRDAIGREIQLGGVRHVRHAQGDGAQI